MSAKYSVGDRVEVLGYTEFCGYMHYNDYSKPTNMNDYIGHVGAITKVVDKGDDRWAYNIDGCEDWLWVDAWIKPEEDPGFLPVDVFETVVSD